jgi:hypothetical protein
VRQVDTNFDINISILRRLHQDITVQQERAAEGATRAGGGRRGSGNNGGGRRISLQERAMRSGWHDKSGQGKDGVAVMTAAAMLSRGQRVVDNAMSQTASGGQCDESGQLRQWQATRLGGEFCNKIRWQMMGGG